jgi:hypothetical protein
MNTQTQNFLFDSLDTQKEVEADNDMETVKEQRIVPFWYRGSTHIAPRQGNGKQTDLEQDIRKFEQWARR